MQKRLSLRQGKRSTIDQTYAPFSSTMSNFDLRDRFNLLEVIGSGGTSTVCKAYDHKLHHLVALKVVQFVNGRDCEFQLYHLLQEAAIHRSLSHPCIIKLLESFHTSTYFAFVLELFEGVDLFEEIETSGPLCEEEARCISIQIASALEYLHGRRVIHRDVKLENIMMSRHLSSTAPTASPSIHSLSPPTSNISAPTPPNSLMSNSSAPSITIKLVDFGLAKYAPRTVQTPCGTLGYTAPEVLQKQCLASSFLSNHRHINHCGYSFAVDIWALGCVVYTMLVGFHPFPVDTNSEDSQQNYLNEPASPTDWIVSFPSPYFDTISDRAIDVIRNCLQPDPFYRWTATQFLRSPWCTGGDATRGGTTYVDGGASHFASFSSKSSRDGSLKAEASLSSGRSVRSRQSRSFFNTEETNESVILDPSICESENDLIDSYFGIPSEEPPPGWDAIPVLKTPAEEVSQSHQSLLSSDRSSCEGYFDDFAADGQCDLMYGNSKGVFSEGWQYEGVKGPVSNGSGGCTIKREGSRDKGSPASRLMSSLKISSDGSQASFVEYLNSQDEAIDQSILQPQRIVDDLSVINRGRASNPRNGAKSTKSKNDNQLGSFQLDLSKASLLKRRSRSGGRRDFDFTPHAS
ncbi:hypothetical protein HDU76_007765 [Blyttiomyces sp. JEL0837]|nr:hypothetical protein HDU76_007765 [Blyttiomyces sp. JEL0837]